jgi:hypothetical protein
MGFLNRLFDEKVSSVSLGLFRILFFSCQIFELIQIIFFKHLIFDPIPILSPTHHEREIFLIAWLITLICIVIGYKTKTALIVNYIFNLFFFSVTTLFEYHIDYVYTAVNFISMFLPLGISLSIDSYIRTKSLISEKISFANAFIIFFPAVVLVYFDSIFHKLPCEMWQKGLGLWLPGSLPQYTWLNLNFILNQELLMKALSHITLLFEATLIFTIWFKSLRFYIFCIGMFLHIGIFIFFPIPFFASAYCALYLLLLPENWAIKLENFLRDFSKVTKKTNSNSSNETLSKNFFITCLFIFTILQTSFTLISPALEPITSTESKKLVHNIKKLSRPILGVTKHGVFVDKHLKLSQYIPIFYYIAPNGERSLLPIYDENGHVGDWVSGRVWANTSFRALNANLPRFQFGLKRYTAFWAMKNKISLQNSRFEVYIKTVEPSFEWKKDHLIDQLNKPLVKYADLIWDNYQFRILRAQ